VRVQGTLDDHNVRRRILERARHRDVGAIDRMGEREEVAYMGAAVRSTVAGVLGNDMNRDRGHASLPLGREEGREDAERRLLRREAADVEHPLPAQPLTQ